MNTPKLTIFLMGVVPYVKERLLSCNQKKEGYLKFIDINSTFSLELEYGITYNQSIDRIHALRIDGSIIKDIKVFQ